MGTRLVLLGIVVLWIATPAWPRQSSSGSIEELTLDRAVALALKDNRQIQVARLEIEKFDNRLGAAKTHRLPHFEFSILAAELITPIDISFEKGDLGTLNGGANPEADVTATAPRRPAFFIDGGIFQPLTQQYRLSLVDRKI